MWKYKTQEDEMEKNRAVECPSCKHFREHPKWNCSSCGLGHEVIIDPLAIPFLPFGTSPPATPTAKSVEALKKTFKKSDERFRFFGR
jgi:hypothetical protein